MLSRPQMLFLAAALTVAGCSPGLEPVGLGPDPTAIAAVVLEPDSIEVFALDTVRFHAVSVTIGGTRRPADGARYSATGGMIDGFGLYLAADTGGQEVRVRIPSAGGELVALAR